MISPPVDGPRLRTLAARSLRPPVADPRFWVIQALAVSAGAVYRVTLTDGGAAVPWLPPHAALALFLIPVMYAALNFGLSGSLATVGWAVLLGCIALVQYHGFRDVVAVGIQLTTLLCIATFVGQRVEREVRARALANAYAAHVVKAQEEERARIAHELHDEPLQQVMQLSRQLDGGADEIASARRLTEEVADGLRRMARGLRPPALEDLGLVAGLRMLARDQAAHTPTTITLAVEGVPRRLGEPAELGLFRIAQEGLRNVERHARATTAHVSLRFDEHDVTLVISDDGVGLPPAPPRNAHDSLGLVGMRERATLLGGTLTVRSQPGTGTTLRAHVPA